LLAFQKDSNNRFVFNIKIVYHANKGLESACKDS